ncbi:MAG: STAS domain-containing protein [Anaerolineae bacterium]|jgi:anti-anti-sigma factor
MQTTTDLGPVTVLAVSGSIDSSTFFDFVKEAEELLKTGYANLVIDLSAVGFVSSGGLKALQTIALRAISHDGKMVLCGVGKDVSRVLRITGFDKLLDIYPDVAAAKASFD